MGLFHSEEDNLYKSEIKIFLDKYTSEKVKIDDVAEIPDLCELIFSKPSGPVEASWGIRKILKHGNRHHILRALSILDALVENCGRKCHGTLPDHKLIERLQRLAGDYCGQPSVVKYLTILLKKWNSEFEHDPEMRDVANIYYSLPIAMRSQFNSKPNSMLTKKNLEREMQYELSHIKDLIAESDHASNHLERALKNSSADYDKVSKVHKEAKEYQRKMADYIQKTHNEEWLGTLLDSHDRITKVCNEYSKRYSSFGDDNRDNQGSSGSNSYSSNYDNTNGKGKEVEKQSTDPFSDNYEINMK